MSKKFSELDRAVSLNNGDLLALAQVDEQAETGYKSAAAPVSDVAQKILKNISFPADLETDSKTALGAINEAAMDKNLADPYSNQATYAVGDFVIYRTVLYKCVTAVSVAEDFDSTKWTQAKVSDMTGGDASSKMDKANPSGTGTFSLNRKANTAVGDYSVTEGYNGTASGNYSHAEGALATASGQYSHAQGYNTIANHKSQMALGEFNLADDSAAAPSARGKYIEIVGNGTANNSRSNARTLDWDGNETLAGDLKFNGSTSLTSSLANFSNLKESLDNLQNYDLSTHIDEKYISTTDGSEKSNSSYFCTGFIEINGANKIQFNAVFKIATVGLAFYSTNNVSGFISGVDNAGGEIGDILKVTVPSGAKYFRTSCLKSQYNIGVLPYVKIIDLSGTLEKKQNNLIVGVNMDATPTLNSNKPVASGGVFEALQDKLGLTDLNALVEKKTFSQLLDKSQFIDGKKLQETAGVSTPDDMTDDPDYTVTNTIELTWDATAGNRSFATNLQTGQFKALGYYLNNGQYVRSGSISTVIQDGDHYTFDIPEVNVKMRLSINRTLVDPNKIIITKSDEWTTDTRYGQNAACLKDKTVFIENLSEELSESIYPSNPCLYKGNSARVFKKILCIGDSLTEGAFNYGAGGENAFIDKTLSYPTFLKVLTGRDTFNAGDAGESTKSWWTLHQNDDLSGYDACIIELGLNDVAGQPSVQCTSQERIEAVGNIISKLKSENTGIKIFISTLLNIYHGTNHESVNSDLRSIVENNSDCYLLDISVYGTLSKQLPDRFVHLTALGYEKMALNYFNYMSYIIDNDVNNDFAFIQYIGTNYTTS